MRVCVFDELVEGDVGVKWYESSEPIIDVVEVCNVWDTDCAKSVEVSQELKPNTE
jgi:hypothetical protein